MVDLSWTMQVQRYVYRFIKLREIVHQMLLELPPDRQAYFIELIAGIDKSIRSDHNGTKDNADGDVK